MTASKAIPAGHTECTVTRKGDNKISTGDRHPGDGGDINYKLGDVIVLPDNVVLVLEDRNFVAVTTKAKAD